MSFRQRRIARQRPVIAAAPRVVVVGHCASGKSTLVENLRSDGIDAVASAQEHSEIAGLWKRSNADLLVYLDVDLETIRERRGRTWPELVFDLQEERLRHAREEADLVIDTARHRAEEVFRRARTYVAWWRHFH
jgi:pantothenate kinase